MTTQLRMFCLLFGLAAPALVLAQTDYTHGHGALQIFDQQGMENAPQWVMIWIMFMAGSFFASLFFVKNHPIARWVAGCFVVGIVVMELAVRVFNVIPLSGFIALIHIVCWSPALFQLLMKRPFLGRRSAFTIWSGIITFVICFSFVFDVRDAFIYLKHLL